MELQFGVEVSLSESLFFGFSELVQQVNVTAATMQSVSRDSSFICVYVIFFVKLQNIFAIKIGFGQKILQFFLREIETEIFLQLCKKDGNFTLLIKLKTKWEDLSF